MRKATVLILALFFMLPLASDAQILWDFQGIFPADSTHPAQILTHGMAVDAENKLWTVDYFLRARLPRPELGDTISTIGIYVFNDDGTEVDFSPIQMIDLPDGTTDTLRTNARGMRADHEGNILAAFGATMYLIDHQTGEGLAKFVHPNNLSLTSPAVDEFGTIYVGTVLADAPVMMYVVQGGEFAFVGNAIPQTNISRTIEVSKDGLQLFYCAPAENAVLMYTRADEFSEFSEAPDTILRGMRVETAAINPVTGHLWVAAGRDGEMPNQDTTVTTNWLPYTWYGYDVENARIVSSITWENLANSVYIFQDGQFVNVEPGTPGGVGPWPRATAFSNDGETIYLGHWSYGIIPAIQKWTVKPPFTLPTSTWESAGVFPDTSTPANHSAHGLAVDNEGKLWVGPYYSTLLREGFRRLPLYIFNEDGTEADFSPIYQVPFEGDTLRFGPITGLNVDHEGNILVAIHGFRYPEDGASWDQSKAYIVRLDASTGELIDVGDVTYMRTETAAQAPNRPAVTEDGYIAVSFVFPASPIIILDPDFQLVQTVTEDKGGFSRSLEISADGNYIYNPGFTEGHIAVYHSEFGVIGEYELMPPTLGVSLMPGAINRDPNDPNILWATATGGGNDPLPADNYYAGHSDKVFAIDLTTNEIVNYAGSSIAEFRIPRSLAFSPDGNVMYLGTFTQGVPTVEKFSYVVSVEPVDRGIVDGFQLRQNYPNPFNPSTTIQFALPQQSNVRLEIFNVLGQRVRTLIADEMYQAGTFNVVWNGLDQFNKPVPSGMYIYRITAGDFVDSKRMMFLK
jgi:hypothetical protein